MWDEAINVFPGMITDTWNTGQVDENGARKIDKARIFSTFYVVGENPSSEWFKQNPPQPGDTPNGSLSYPYKNIQDAIDRVIGINDGSMPFTIYVDGKLTLENSQAQLALIGTSDKNLNLRIQALSDKATLDAKQNGRVMTINAPTNASTDKKYTIALKNLVITGGTNGNKGGGMYIDGAGDIALENCEICGNSAGNYGGGIYVENAQKITITGGEISGNSSSNGGAIYLSAKETTMTDARIFDNNATSFGGGIYFGGTDANLTLVNCGIKNNTSDSSSGGVYVASGRLTMNSGEISENYFGKNGGGVYVSSGELTINNSGRISGSKVKEGAADDTCGGGVYVSNGGIITINDGEISGNTAASGAGIHSDGGRIFMKSRAIVTNNHGAGICATGPDDESAGTEIDMETGAIIRGNQSNAESGGVLVNNGSVFRMSGGTISGNEAGIGNTDKSKGGGVYVGKKGRFEMSGGIVGSENDTDSNKASYGGGVYVNTNGTFKMSGSAKIRGNDVYLYGDSTITIAGAFDNTVSTVATITPSAYPSSANVKNILSADGENITPEICAQFAVTPQIGAYGNLIKWEIVPSGEKKFGILQVNLIVEYYVSGTGNDDNTGISKDAPFATLKKTIDTMLSANDGTTNYTIFVDGEVTLEGWE